MADTSMTGAFRISLPKELLVEANRKQQAGREKLQVEGFKRSWLTRLSELLIGKD